MEEIRKVCVRDMLIARDERAGRQRQLLERHAAPLVSFTMNIPGEIKCDGLIRRAFNAGKARILSEVGVNIVGEIETVAFTGCEYLCAVTGDAKEIKARMQRIEERDALGRLFDIDVLSADGEKLSREAGHQRRCLLCGQDARICGRARTHTAEELNRKAHEIIRGHFDEAYALNTGAAARQALIDEAETTPKPGLVDLENSGAHRDMDISHFRKSAFALENYFAEAARIGIKMRGMPAEEVFEALQTGGRNAEKTMLDATGGVNTHKGAIFSLGILCCAAGYAGEGAARNEVLAAAAEMGKVSLNAFCGLAPENARTGGEIQFVRQGLTGVRGEAASGFQSVRDIALPVYERVLADGYDANDAGLRALIALMAKVSDSNVIRRAGDSGAAYMRETACRLISEGFNADELRRVNDDFVRRDLSPGGCADLLAATYFLHEITE